MNRAAVPVGNPAPLLLLLAWGLVFRTLQLTGSFVVAGFVTAFFAILTASVYGHAYCS